MPCTSGGPSPYEMALDEVARLREQLDRVERMLCDACTSLDANNIKLPTGAVAWWEKHTAQEEAEIRTAALRKLSPRERKVLGAEVSYDDYSKRLDDDMFGVEELSKVLDHVERAAEVPVTAPSALAARSKLGSFIAQLRATPANQWQRWGADAIERLANLVLSLGLSDREVAGITGRTEHSIRSIRGRLAVKFPDGGWVIPELCKAETKRWAGNPPVPGRIARRRVK